MRLAKLGVEAALGRLVACPPVGTWLPSGSWHTPLLGLHSRDLDVSLEREENVNLRTAGIHHVIAIAAAPQRNLDFYEGILGLRLVKKTVNFDDPGTYHLYYGDEIVHPATIMTFFPWPGAVKGRRGTGQLAAPAFAIPVKTRGSNRHPQKIPTTSKRGSRGSLVQGARTGERLARFATGALPGA